MPTLFEKLEAAGVPVQTATEGGQIVIVDTLTPEQEHTLSEILLEHFQPIQYADVLQVRADQQQLKDLYQTVITRLEQIESAANPTNAQVIAAVRDIAKYERWLYKVLRRMI